MVADGIVRTEICRSVHHSTLQRGGRLGSRRVTQHELHQVGPLCNEVVAFGQVAQHHGIQREGIVGAVVALQDDAEVTAVGCNDVWQTDPPFIGDMAVGVKCDLVGLHLVDLAHLIAG